MKVFIRRTKNGWYYQEPAKWTPDQKEAHDLKQVARAVEKIFQDRLEDVEILLSYDEPRYDLVLPVPTSPSRLAPPRPSKVSEQGLSGEDAPPAVQPKKAPSF
jgi:hypothetical protein